MSHTVSFNSTDHPDGELISLACGFISLTRIVFENEQLQVEIEARTGRIDFFDMADNKLLSAKATVPLDGDEKFSEVKCSVDNGQLLLGFPEYTYEDNYPHCDGEHDRWTKVIEGFRFLRYHIQDNRIEE